MNKKIGLLAGFVLSIFLISFISAASFGFGYLDLRQGSEQIIQSAVDIFEPFLNVLLGGQTTGYTGYLLFEKLIMFLLILSLVYLSLKNIEIFKENTGVLWIISILVPLLGVRFLDFMWLNTILIQYKILAIALTAGLPFIIYALFLYNILGEHKSLRKIGWVFFMVLYFGLWSTSSIDAYPEVYFWTALLSLVFLLLDGTIRRYLLKQKIEEGEEATIMQRIAQIDKEIKDLRASGLPADKLERRIRHLEIDRHKLTRRLQ